MAEIILHFPVPEKTYAHLLSNRIREHERVRRKEAKLKRQAERFENLLSYVIWPDAVKLLSVGDMSTLRRQRDVS